jgi:predicted nucleic acid-binding protein
MRLRPALRGAVSGASVEDVDEILDALVRIAEPVEISYLWRPHLVDPGDELVLETAVNGGADVIVTFDLRHLASVAAGFGIAVNTPGTIVHRLEKECS